MKMLFLIVYLMATPDDGGSFPDGMAHVKTFEGSNALTECVDMVYNIQRNWPGGMPGMPDFFCVPKGD